MARWGPWGAGAGLVFMLSVPILLAVKGESITAAIVPTIVGAFVCAQALVVTVVLRPRIRANADAIDRSWAD